MRARYLLAAWLCLAPVAAAATTCPCDCNGDGSINISELIAALNVALGSAPASSCPALPDCPPDGICILIASLVRCVDLALSGGCSTEPTPTPLPGPATLPALLDAVAADVCAGVLQTIGGGYSVTATGDEGTVRCDSFTGHNGWVRLVRLPSAAAAIAAWGAPEAEEAVSDVAGGRLRNRTSRGAPCADCRSQDWRWVRSCFLATGHAFDDTDYLFAPQPAVAVSLLAAAPRFAELLAACPP